MLSNGQVDCHLSIVIDEVKIALPIAQHYHSVVMERLPLGHIFLSRQPPLSAATCMYTFNAYADCLASIAQTALTTVCLMTSLRSTSDSASDG